MTTFLFLFHPLLSRCYSGMGVRNRDWFALPIYMFEECFVPIGNFSRFRHVLPYCLEGIAGLNGRFYVSSDGQKCDLLYVAFCPGGFAFLHPLG